jgi:hypothetical protein
MLHQKLAAMVAENRNSSRSQATTTSPPVVKTSITLSDIIGKMKPAFPSRKSGTGTSTGTGPGTSTGTGTTGSVSATGVGNGIMNAGITSTQKHRDTAVEVDYVRNECVRVLDVTYTPTGSLWGVLMHARIVNQSR